MRASRRRRLTRGEDSWALSSWAWSLDMVRASHLGLRPPSEERGSFLGRTRHLRLGRGHRLGPAKGSRMSKTDRASRRRWPVRAHLVVLAVVVSLVFVAVGGGVFAPQLLQDVKHT